MYKKYDCAVQGKTHGVYKATKDLEEMLPFLAQNVAPKCIFSITRSTQVPDVFLDFADVAAMNRQITSLRGEMMFLNESWQELNSPNQHCTNRSSNNKNYSNGNNISNN